LDVVQSSPTLQAILFNKNPSAHVKLIYGTTCSDITAPQVQNSGVLAVGLRPIFDSHLGRYELEVRLYVRGRGQIAIVANQNSDALI